MLRSSEQFFHYQVDDKAAAAAPLLDEPTQEVRQKLTRELPLQPDLDVQAKSELQEIPADAFLVFSIGGYPVN
jgi:hypothetical protein